MRSVIFGDLVPKLAELVEERMPDGPLIDQQAIYWDVETLSERPSPRNSTWCSRCTTPCRKATCRTSTTSLSSGPVALICDTFTLQLWVPKGPYNKANRIPYMKRDKSELKTVGPRWRYGPMLAAGFATLRV
jgi:hypothetical protein